MDRQEAQNVRTPRWKKLIVSDAAFPASGHTQSWPDSIRGVEETASSWILIINHDFIVCVPQVVPQDRKNASRSGSASSRDPSDINQGDRQFPFASFRKKNNIRI